MKKTLLLAFAFVVSMAVNATDLFTGSKHVSWSDGSITIPAAQIPASITAGNVIRVSYTGATDGMEFKNAVNFDHIPGSREAMWINGDGAVELFLTQAAAAKIKECGFEVIGANFTCTKIELNEGKAGNLKDGELVWTGFFWADEWSTLEIYSDSYKDIDFSKYKAIRFYSEAGRTDYVLNFKENWDESGHFAGIGDMTVTNDYAELTLTDALRTRLKNAGHWMIQFNKEGGSAFNATDIVLVPNEATSVTTIKTNSGNAAVYDMMGRKASANQKGLLISNGRKFMK